MFKSKKQIEKHRQGCIELWTSHYQDDVENGRTYMAQIMSVALSAIKNGANPFDIEDWVIRSETLRRKYGTLMKKWDKQ